MDGPVRQVGARSGQAERGGDPLGRDAAELAPTERSVERRPGEPAHLRESAEKHEPYTNFVSSSFFMMKLLKRMTGWRSTSPNTRQGISQASRHSKSLVSWWP